MVGWHHWLNGHEFEQASGVGDGQGGLMCCSPWGRKESGRTERLHWTDSVCSKIMGAVPTRHFYRQGTALKEHSHFSWQSQRGRSCHCCSIVFFSAVSLGNRFSFWKSFNLILLNFIIFKSFNFIMEFWNKTVALKCNKNDFIHDSWKLILILHKALYGGTFWAHT